jgi:hypothetical protein
LFGFLGCSEKYEVAKQLLHPEGCSLIFLTSKRSMKREKKKVRKLFTYSY